MIAPTITDRLLEPAPSVPPTVAAWAKAVREKGQETFSSLGVPDRRIEAWKYSDLAAALGKARAANGPKTLPPAPEMAATVTFVDGIIDTARSNLIDGVSTPLAEVLCDADSGFAKKIGRINSSAQLNHPIVNLNAAHIGEGVVISVGQNTAIPEPIVLCFVWSNADNSTTQTTNHIRLFIELEDNASAEIVEIHCGSPGFTTIVSEISLGAHAQLTHTRIERLGDTARQSAITLGEVGASAAYKAFYFTLGSTFSRHEALFELSGENANVEIDGIFLTAESRHCDNSTILTHAVANTKSRQAFRGVMTGNAQAAYQGCVKVRQNAQKTDASQISRTLLLSNDARIANKPELDILADDVKCSHGATVGELDANALFFLRARGIPEAEARALLVEGFLDEALSTITNEALLGLARDCVTEWLAVHAGEVSHAG